VLENQSRARAGERDYWLSVLCLTHSGDGCPHFDSSSRGFVGDASVPGDGIGGDIRANHTHLLPIRNLRGCLSHRSRGANNQNGFTGLDLSCVTTDAHAVM